MMNEVQADSPSTDELVLTRLSSGIELVGSFLFLLGLYLILFGFVGLAIINLLDPYSTPLRGVIASGIFLLLVFAITFSACKSAGGIIQFLVNRLGEFACRQFVRIERHDEKNTAVCFGYWIMKQRFYNLKIDIAQIESIGWHSGQGTAMAGRDMDDWRVVIFYDLPNTQLKTGKALASWTQGVYTVGRTGPKDEVVKFGLAFVPFICRAGAALKQSDDGRKFLRIK